MISRKMLNVLEAQIIQCSEGVVSTATTIGYTLK
jgi:hypothetical protein